MTQAGVHAALAHVVMDGMVVGMMVGAVGARAGQAESDGLGERCELLGGWQGGATRQAAPGEEAEQRRGGRCGEALIERRGRRDRGIDEHLMGV